MTDCTCKPGTYENGWHEIRGVECVEAEREQWRRMLERARAWPIFAARGAARD